MKSITLNLLCRFLIITMLVLPFQSQAGIISTDQASNAASAQADRTTVLNTLSRAATARELQSFGVDPQSARDRVAAMTDQEVSSLAGKINAVPAGADSGLIALILVIFLIWIVVYRK